MAFTHRFDPTTLREYDIRGIVGRTLSDADAFAIGRCFGSIVARQGGTHGRRRLRWPAVQPGNWRRRWSKGLSASGIEAVRIGRGPTPMLYYAATTLKTDGAVMVTGSHNPPDYNGFKMVLARQAVLRRADPARSATHGAGRRRGGGDARRRERNVDVSADYVARLLADWDGGDRLLKVVWDNGNGAAGEVLQRLVAGLPGEHIVLNGDDRRHGSRRIIRIRRCRRICEQLIAEVAARRADIGIALDGDADRIGLVDDKGRILFGDQLMVLLARDVLREHPGATIIADVKASQVLFDEIARAGGNPLMWRTGHSLIKAKMAETGSPLAGEMSGHIFFADRWYGFDDALYAAVRMLGVLARMDSKLSDGARCAAAGDQHARGALRLRRHAQVRGDRGGRGTAACGRREGVGDRRRARADRRRLVAAARVQHAGSAGGARRGRHRGWTGAVEAGAGEAA